MKPFFLLALAALFCACSSPQVEEKPFEVTGEPSNRVQLSSEIEWEQLNPARGDKSPLAGTVWGDRKGEVATGFLAKFVDGFSSPPHIHNVTYRAMVLKGLVHNDDSSAADMWMPAGSFWTQPAGAPHITSAKGEENIAYVEIDSGPYLVNPISESYDNGERPINVDARNIMWLDASQSRLIHDSLAGTGVEIAHLWESETYAGYLLKLPSGSALDLYTTGETVHAVVVTGLLNYTLPQTQEPKSLDPGSYFGSSGNAIHDLGSPAGPGSVVYIRTNGSIQLH